MKQRTVKLMAALCVGTLAMGMLVGCGSKGAETATADTQATAEVAESEEATAEETTEEAEAVVSGTADGLLAEVEGEDAFAILSGVADGWAPTVMVLGNDNSFYCLVDYAGQSTVNIIQGTWEENEDGSITANGALYTDGSDMVIDVAKADDGTYSADIAIPDTEAVAHCEGTAK